MNLNALKVVLFTIALVITSVQSHPDREQLTVEVKEPKIETIEYEEAYNREENIGQIKEINPESGKRVSYSGSQLWKVKIDDNYDKKKILAQLRDDKGSQYFS